VSECQNVPVEALRRRTGMTSARFLWKFELVRIDVSVREQDFRRSWIRDLFSHGNGQTVARGNPSAPWPNGWNRTEALHNLLASTSHAVAGVSNRRCRRQNGAYNDEGPDSRLALRGPKRSGLRTRSNTIVLVRISKRGRQTLVPD
jgi:hypothetical protein